ncbi:gephyrin-like molybdotransferase Glp [Roseibium aggregatum]|uniref:Molybdopterin molybdenumtransferase n=1 Tax=Roseibium aggregatum TaxID=187304 RepID=A0A926S894_9HYPH|nr:gephyrin-like molybdotransferase Glp [Roseibium aggregatum]MBD1544659.1 molybdopterin molybdotransferase MoeA [Roseibium aggregatum]
MSETVQRDCCSAAADTKKPLATIEQTIERAIGLCATIEGTEVVPVTQAVGRTAAFDVISYLELPLRDHSAVDGYALGGTGTGPFRIVGRTTAGETAAKRLSSGQALRIMTGAPVPPGTEAVVMQEHVTVSGDQVTAGFSVPAGDNIRCRGEDVSSMDTLVRAGARIDPRHVAILAASGYQGLEVRRKLRVALLSTGNELRDPGVGMGPGSIFDTNRPMLQALLAEERIDITDLGIKPDKRDVISDCLAEAARHHDLIITSGGVSVGEEDHIKPAILDAGGHIESWCMAIKPGKPITLGRLDKAVFLGLPGNPLACFVDFLLVGRPLMDSLEGRPTAFPSARNARAGFSWERRPGRREFFPATVVGVSDEGLPVIEKIGRAGSARLMPLIEADGLGAVDSTCGSVEPGSGLQFFPFKSQMKL